MRSCTGAMVSFSALPGPVRERELERLALVHDPLTGQRLAHDVHVLARSLQLAAEAHAVPALRHLRSGRPQPEPKAPSEIWSSVAAVIAVIAGLRPGIWKMAEPRLIFSVWPASHASTVAASEP